MPSTASFGERDSECPPDPDLSDGFPPCGRLGGPVDSAWIPLLGARICRRFGIQTAARSNPGWFLKKKKKIATQNPPPLLTTTTLCVFQHVERTFYESNGLIRKRDSGYWLMGLDRHINADTLAPLEPKEPVQLVSESTCHALPYCGLPYYFPSLKRIR